MFYNETPVTTVDDARRLVEEASAVKLQRQDVEQYVVLVDEATAFALFEPEWKPESRELVQKYVNQAREAHTDIDFELHAQYDWTLGDTGIEAEPIDPDLFHLYVFPTSTRSKRLRQRKNHTSPEELFRFNYDDLWVMSMPNGAGGVAFYL